MNIESNPSKTVNSLISRRINPGHEKDYDDWLRRFLAFERTALGYLGTTVVLPGGIRSTYGIFVDLLIRPRWRYGITRTMSKNY
jgi:antibiotic biosynthesis monooxygenase (ABM) superfamily enzyme